jgi:LysM repeat protein
MVKDERQSGGPEQVARNSEPQRASRPAPGKVTRTSRLSPGQGPAVQRKAAVPAPGAGGSQARSAWDLTMDSWMDAAHRGVTAEQDGGGKAIPEDVQTKMEGAFGADFSGVRVHESARPQALGALAYAQGTDIHVAPGQYDPRSQRGQELLGHELTHVVQQAQGRVSATAQAKGVGVNDDAGLERKADEMGARAARGESVAADTARSTVAPASPRPAASGMHVQCYEAGEHAQLGETQDELQAGLADTTSYTVKKGEHLHTIAARFGVTVAALQEANKDKVRRWPATDGSGRMIEGFNAGETVNVPHELNDFARAATRDKSATFTVNGVVLDYGVGIAMGDFFESPAQMAKATPQELTRLVALIKREQSGGKPVTTEEWEKATGGRYLKLAEKNETHFAPQDGGLVTASTAGASSPNHQREWEKHHAAALAASQAGDKDKALQINAFGDHFLTDAFAAGHLVNKRDLMEKFKGQLQLDAKGEEFIPSSRELFDAVATAAFTGNVKAAFSRYETVETHYGVHADIDRVSRFSTLLQEIHKEEPDLLANAVAKGVHDKLNTMPGGLPVVNAKGDHWNLSGDGTLNARSKEMARRAVAQSQINVISAYKLAAPPDHAGLYKKVWDYTPKPSPEGTGPLQQSVTSGTDVKSAALRQAIVKLIQDNYELLLAELIKRNKLQKA